MRSLFPATPHTFMVSPLPLRYISHKFTPLYIYRVLDECDEMLNMGFVDDVETILNAASKNADGSASAAAGPGACVCVCGVRTVVCS